MQEQESGQGQPAAVGRRHLLRRLGGAAAVAGAGTLLVSGRDGRPALAQTAPQPALELAGTFDVEFGTRLRGLFSGVSGPFSGVSGPGTEHEVYEDRVLDPTTGREVTRPLPGRLRLLELRLARPVSDDLTAWLWRQLVVDGRIRDARVAGMITLVSERGPTAHWRVQGAWPSLVTVAAVGGALLEVIAIVYESIQRERL